MSPQRRTLLGLAAALLALAGCDLPASFARQPGAATDSVYIGVAAAHVPTSEAYFRDDPRVVAVVGHTGSAQTMEAAPVYADLEEGGRRALAAVSPTATNPAVTREGDWVFRVCPTDVDGARALARFALDSAR